MSMPNKWDTLFHDVCVALSKASRCMSRQIGAVVVRDNTILATGYNGPARGVPHCDSRERYEWLKKNYMFYGSVDSLLLKGNKCPRREMGYSSGEGLQFCPAAHAEQNCIANAARTGVSLIGGTLYLNTVIPCTRCMALIINSGITHIVCEEMRDYDIDSAFQARAVGMLIREFEL